MVDTEWRPFVVQEEDDMTEYIEIAVSDVTWREDLYPRIERDPVLVQRYAENLDMMPPIEINQHNILIDGWHR